MKKFGIRDKVSYMMGDIGCNLVLTLANSYLMVFYTKVMGVSAAIIGTIFMVSRIIDAFTDMIVGRIVDTHTGKNGDRYRPWIAYGSIPLVICSSLMYNYFLAEGSSIIKIVWLVITYLLFGSVCYTAVNVPYGAMSSVITNEPAQRTSLSVWRSVGATLGSSVLGIILPLVVYVKNDSGQDVVSGPRFLGVSILLGCLALVAFGICYFGTTERVKIKKIENNIGSLHAIGSCLRDRALMCSIINTIFVYAATTLFNTFNQYLFLDYFGNTSLSGLASLMMMIGMLAAAPFSLILSKKIGKKEVGIVGTGLSVVTYIVMYIAHIDSPYIYILGVLITFFGLGLVSTVGFALMNDCIDNHYLLTKDLAGGTIYALSGFARKVTAALCTGLGGWGLAWIGYDELAVSQIGSVKEGIFKLGIGLPTVCFLISLIALFFFPLNKKEIERISTEMKKINNSNTGEN